MKKLISLLTVVTMLAAAGSAFPASADDAALLLTGFEDGLDGWGPRNSESVEISTTAFAGKQGAAVTNRKENWHGIAKSLDTAVFKPGTAYSFGAMVMQQSSPMPATFQLSLQYSDGAGGGMFFGGETKYLHIAEKQVISGTWTQLNNLSFSIPEGAQNLILYIETTDSTCDFFVDEIYIMPEGQSLTYTTSPGSFAPGDVNHDGKINSTDAFLMQDFLFDQQKDGTDDMYADTADLNADGRVTAVDFSLLKQEVIHPAETTPVVTTGTTQTSSTSTTSTTVTTPDPGPGGKTDPTVYMQKVREAVTLNVPGEYTAGDSGKTDHINYYSKKAEKQKGAYVWLPPGYSQDKQYPVMYVNHGIFGDESSMLQGFGVREIASKLAQDGHPMILVFTAMYTSKDSNQCAGINAQETARYDAFLEDLTESLMPYIEENYPVKTGRDNTGICGFSMGGRESLYIGISRPDLFGYIGASSPAPGVTPTQDKYMVHPGSMPESDFRITENLPYVLMLAGGTADNVVEDHPERYHKLLERNQTDHIWFSVANGGHDGSVGIPLMYNFLKAAFQA